MPPAEESTPLLCGNGPAAAAEDNHNAAAGKHPNPDQERNDDSPGTKAVCEEPIHIFSDDYDLAGGSPRADGSLRVASDGIVACMASEMANLNVGWKCPRGDDDDDESESTNAIGVTERRENEAGTGLSLSPNSSTSVRDLASPTGWEPVPSPDSRTSSVDISPFTVDAGDTTTNPLGFVGAGMPFDNADAMDLMSVLGAEKSPSTLATPGNINIAATNSFSCKKKGVDFEPIGGTNPYKEVTKADGLLTEEWNGSPPSISASSLPTPLPSVYGSPYSQPLSDSIANNFPGMDGDDSGDRRNANNSIGRSGDGGGDGGDWLTEYGNGDAVAYQLGGVKDAASAENLSPSDDRSVHTVDLDYIITGLSHNKHHADMERNVIAVTTPAHDAGGGVNADGDGNGSAKGGRDDDASIIRDLLTANAFVPLDRILDTSTAKPRLKLIIQCTEMFLLTPANKDKYSQNNAVAVAGQVGIRCALCKNEQEKGRHSSSLLTQPDRLYDLVKILSKEHLEKTCTCVDDETGAKLAKKDKGKNVKLGPQGMETMLNEISIFETVDALGDGTMRVFLSSNGDDSTGDDTEVGAGFGEPEGEHIRGQNLGQAETELCSGDAEEEEEESISTGKSAGALRMQAKRDAEKLKRNQVAEYRLAARRGAKPVALPTYEAKAAVNSRTRKIALQKTRRRETKSDDDEESDLRFLA